MRHSDLFYVLALQKVDGIGDINAKKLLSHFGSAEEIFKASASSLSGIDGIGSVLQKNLRNKAVFGKAEKELRFIEENAIEVLYFQEENYPERLKHCIDGPVLLFGSGNIDFQNRRLISIVGTRQVTANGAAFCRELIAELAPLNPVIVSGFAYGVDIIAHQSAIEHNLQTIGVLAHGLNQVYPKAHKKYWNQVESNGGFITEFWSSSNPERQNFVRRNRIVAGISEATIVIESADKGGSLVTASMANDYDRDVFAVPGRPSDTFSQGCNNLIKSQKANLLTCAADLVYMLNWDLADNPRPIQKSLPPLEAHEQKIYDFLQQNGKETLDVVARECDFPVHLLSGTLLNMELKGAIRPLPGKLFEVV